MARMRGPGLVIYNSHAHKLLASPLLRLRVLSLSPKPGFICSQHQKMFHHCLPCYLPSVTGPQTEAAQDSFHPMSYALFLCVSRTLPDVQHTAHQKMLVRLTKAPNVVMCTIYAHVSWRCVMITRKQVREAYGCDVSNT